MILKVHKPEKPAELVNEPAKFFLSYTPVLSTLHDSSGLNIFFKQYGNFYSNSVFYFSENELAII